jgi:inorganic pyrophosphatase
MAPLAVIIEKLAPQSKDGTLNVVIETPKGSRNKFDFDEKTGMFKLGGVLPAGAVFPFDFGFIPQTLGEDGDPLDVLVLMDEPAFAGCLVPARLIGVIEANQTERDGTTVRNDRFVAVAFKSYVHDDLQSLCDVNDTLLREIEYFFESYNTIRDKHFETLAHSGPERAQELLEIGAKQFKAQKRKASTRKQTK